MPIYAYRCESCGLAKDVLQKISDDVLTDCPACGAAAFKKQLTAAGFQLKGSGWYATDFRNGTSSGEKPATSVTAPAVDAIKPAESTPVKSEATASPASKVTSPAAPTPSSNTST